MSRDKQIDEMAKAICEHFVPHGCGRCPDCFCEGDALKLYNVCYRKASDVAREIFEELETVLYKIAKPIIRADGILETKIMDGFHIRIEDYNAIRKKYESEVEE